jgi:hypothetical protein
VQAFSAKTGRGALGLAENLSFATTPQTHQSTTPPHDPSFFDLHISTLTQNAPNPLKTFAI